MKKEIKQIKKILEQKKELLKIHNKTILQAEKKIKNETDIQEISMWRININRYKELNKELEKGIRCDKEILKILEK